MPVKTRLMGCRVAQLKRMAIALGLDSTLRWKELVESIAAVPDDEAQEELSPEDWDAVCPRPNLGRERISARKAPDGGGGKDDIQVLLRISEDDYRRLRVLVNDDAGETAAYHARCAMREYLGRHVPTSGCVGGQTQCVGGQKKGGDRPQDKPSPSPVLAPTKPWPS
jgi:hypothetical protein